MRSMHGQRPVVVPGIPARLAALALLANVRGNPGGWSEDDASPRSERLPCRGLPTGRRRRRVGEVTRLQAVQLFLIQLGGCGSAHCLRRMCLHSVVC